MGYEDRRGRVLLDMDPGRLCCCCWPGPRRMFPLTEKRTLPAIPLVGVYRLIDIPLSSLLNSGVNKVFVLTQYNSTSLNRYLQHTCVGHSAVLCQSGQEGCQAVLWWQYCHWSSLLRLVEGDEVPHTLWYDIHDSITLGRDCFVEVVAATQGPKEQRWAEGAVDAVRQWMEMWAPNANSRSIEDVLVLPSDQIYRLDFTQLIDMHRQSCADLTLVCKPVEEAMLNFMGAVKVGPGAQVIGFEEKPVPERHDQLSMDWDDLVDFMNEPHLASVPFLDPAEGGRTWVGSCGIMVFRSQALQRLLGDNVRAKDFGRDLIPAALKAGMKARDSSAWPPAEGGQEPKQDLTRNQVDFSFQDPASPVFGHPDPLPPTMCEDCQLHSSLLAMGCLLRSSSIRSSVIGSRTIIGPGCDIRDSVIMGADYYEHEKQWLRKVGPTYPAIGLGAGCVVHKAIVDKNARIGSNVQLVNKEGVFESMDRIGTGISITGGIIVISKAAVVPDGTREPMPLALTSYRLRVAVGSLSIKAWCATRHITLVQQEPPQGLDKGYRREVELAAITAMWTSRAHKPTSGEASAIHLSVSCPEAGCRAQISIPRTALVRELKHQAAAELFVAEDEVCGIGLHVDLFDFFGGAHLGLFLLLLVCDCVCFQGRGGKPPGPQALFLEAFSKPADTKMVFKDGSSLLVHRWILELSSHLLQDVMAHLDAAPAIEPPPGSLSLKWSGQSSAAAAAATSIVSPTRTAHHLTPPTSTADTVARHLAGLADPADAGAWDQLPGQAQQPEAAGCHMRLAEVVGESPGTPTMEDRAALVSARITTFDLCAAAAAAAAATAAPVASLANTAAGTYPQQVQDSGRGGHHCCQPVVAPYAWPAQQQGSELLRPPHTRSEPGAGSHATAAWAPSPAARPPLVATYSGRQQLQHQVAGNGRAGDGGQGGGGGVAGANYVAAGQEVASLHMPEDDAYSWTFVLQLLYPCCQMRRPPVTWGNIHRILQLADKWAMSSVLRVCQDFLLLPSSQLSTSPEEPSYVWTWLLLADRLAMPAVVRKCLLFIQVARHSAHCDLAGLQASVAEVVGQCSQGVVVSLITSLIASKDEAMAQCKP
ncbi:hypothetical protein QJQ45_019208 [Haematococcus lacustris]|nr:hypothetical protein QJQ45_019208 [Haematococcus lacustris]